MRRGPSRDMPAHTVWWFEWVSLWGTYDVVLADPKRCPAVSDAFGVADIQNRLIYLDWSLEIDRLTYTFFHEAIHTVLSTPGDTSLFAHIFGCKKKQADEWEEALIVHLTGRLEPALFANGFLKLPKLPKLPRKARHRRSEQR
jgi:hypothetical protein